MKRLIILSLLLAACATTPQPANEIDALLDQPPFDHSFWSVLVEEDDGRVLYARNADKLTIPASNRKVFASAAIANCLGADAQLATTIWRDGEDLILAGDGDPSLGSWRYERSDDFDRLAQSLQARGITRVRDVIADVSAFDRVTIPGSWKYGNLGADYAAPVDALAWGENEIADNRAVPDPALHAATALRDALVARGIDVAGVPRVNTERRAWSEQLATIPSPFIAQLLATVLKNSHNLYAEMLLKRVATGVATAASAVARRAGAPVATPAVATPLLATPASYSAALAAERAFLVAEPRIDGQAFRFVDGSGLAPDDLVTPEATIRMLRWMNHPSRRGLWWSVLAQPNNDGTLRRRLVALEHRLRGKTGTINGVNALSGIIDMQDGRYRYFCIVANHHIGEGSDANRIIDSVVELVSRTSPRTASSP